MAIARERRRGKQDALGWLLAAWLALAAAAGFAAEQRYVYDELGRLIAVIDPAGETTRYTYDEAGNLTSVSRASSAQVSIVSFSPARGRFGDSVNIFGTGFSATPSQNAVTFNGTPAAVTASTTTSITAIVPTAAASGLIAVTTPLGSATSAQPFTVVVPQPPQISSFSPTIVAPNGTVAISGSAFEPVPAENQVRVNAATAVVIAATDESLTVRAPNATGGRIGVTTSNGSASTADDLFIVPPPNAATDVAATARIALDGPGAALSLPQGKIGLALFDGVAGAVGVKVSLRDVSISSGALTVYAPNGATFASANFGAGGATLSLPALPATGSYGVRVTSSGGNATVAAWRDISGTLAVGVPTDITFTNPGQQARFTFTAAAGDLMGLDVSGVTLAGNTNIRVLRPDGIAVIDTSFGAAGAGIRIPQASAGEFTVIITPASGGTGSVRLTLWRDVGGTLVLETPQDVSIDFRNQQARLTFVAAAGDILGLEVSDVGLSGNTGIRVLRPDGIAIIDSAFAAAGTGFRIQQGGAGTYTVIITPASGGTGSVRLTLWRDVGGTLAPDTPQDVSIGFRNQQARLAFTAAAGDFLGLDVSNVVLAGNTGIRVLRPDGIAVIDSAFAAAGAGFRIPQGGTGTYTVIITPASGGTGSVRLTLWRDVADTIAFDAPRDVSIAFLNQQARFTFTASASDSLGLDLSNVTFPGNTGIRVLRPDGIAVIDTSFAEGAGAGLRVPQGGAGNYTVIITPASGAVGALKLALWRDIGGELALGSPVDVAVQYRSQIVRKTFVATAGQNLGVELTDLAGFASGGIRIQRPDGITVVDTVFSATANSFRVPASGAGTYTVTLTPASGAVGTFKLRLWSDVSDTLLVDTPYALSIGSANQQARFTFTAAATDFMGIDIANVTLPANSGLRVLRPDGIAILDTTFASGAGAGFRIPQGGTGVYTVIITPAGGGTGDARVTLWRDVGGTLEVGTPANLTVAYRNQALRQTFTGTGQQFLGLDVANVAFSGGLRVLRPDGIAVLDTTFPAGSGGGFRILQGGAGTYTVIVTPTSGAVGNVRVTLWEDVPGALTVGPQIDVAIPFRNQAMRKTFAASGSANLGVDLSDFSGFTSGGLRVLRPDGIAVLDTPFSGAAGGSFRIPQAGAGTFTIIVTPTSDGVGSFKLRLWSDVTDALSIETPYALDITIRNQQGRLPFSGAAGSNLGLELSAVTFPGGGIVNVLRPDGIAMLSTSFGSGGLSVNLPTLGQTGTYVVNIIPAASGTGGATVRVFNR